MPKTVEFPELGSVDFPDEMSWEDIDKTIRDQNIYGQMKQAKIQQMEAETIKEDPPTLADRYVQGVRSVGKGAISGVAGTLKAVGEMAAAVNRKVYDGGEDGTVRSGNPKDLTTYKLGQGLDQSAEDASPDLPGLENSFWNKDVPSGVGQVGGALITGGAVRGAVTKGATKLGMVEAAKLGTRAGVRAGLTQMAGSEFDDAYQRSIDRGDSADLATAKAAGYAVLASAIEAKLGVGRVMKRFGLGETAAQELNNLAKTGIAKTAMKEAAAGFTEEALQRAAQDYIVDGQLDLNAVVREGGAGAVVQALLGSLGHAGRRRSAQDALNWIRERQQKGMTIDDLQEAGVSAETAFELGIPMRFDDPGQQQKTDVAEDSKQAPGGEARFIATEHLKSILGGELPASVEIYDSEGETHESGSLVRGSRVGDRIRLNVGNIESTSELESVLIEEAFHGVEHDPSIQTAIQDLQAAAPKVLVSEMESLGYAPEVAPIEAVARMLQSEHLEGKARTAWQKFWAGFRTQAQRYFGWAGAKWDDVNARKVIARALSNLIQQRAPTSQETATAPAIDPATIRQSQTVAEPLAQNATPAEPVPVPPAAVNPQAGAVQEAEAAPAPAPAPTVVQRFSLTKPRPTESQVREHVDQINASRDVDDTIKELVSNHMYQPRTNDGDAAFAAELVNRFGLDQAEGIFREAGNGLPEAIRTMVGSVVVKEYGRQEREARAAQKISEAQAIARKAARFISDDVLPRSTEVAQALQAFKAFSFLTPGGWIATAKRVVDRVQGSRMAKLIKPTTQTAQVIQEVNKKAAKKVVARVSEQAKAILRILVANNTEVQWALRDEIAAAEFPHLKELLADHFSGRNPGKSLAEKLQLIYQMKPEEAAKEAARLEKKWAQAVSQVKASLPKRVAQQQALWDQYQQQIAGTVISVVKSKLAGPKREAALQGFSERLAAVLKEHVDNAMEETPGMPKQTKLTDAQIIAEALNNPEKYEEAWVSTVKALRAEFADQPAVLERLDQAIRSRPDLVSESKLEKIIATKLKESGAKMDEVIRSHWMDQAAAGRSIADRFVKEVGVPGPEAVQLAKSLENQFKLLTTRAKEQAIKQLIKAGQGARVANNKTKAHRLIEASNMGALSNDEAVAVVAESVGVPALSKAAIAEIADRADALQQMPDDSVQRQRATVQLMNFIASQKGFAWWELPVAFWYANTLSGPITHLINASSNLLSLGGNLASVLARQPAAIGVASQAVYEGFRQGALDAAEILKTGINPRTNTKFEASGGLELLRDKDLKGAGVVLNKWKYVGRMLSAADQLFFVPAREAKAAILARGLAKSEGLKGDALEKRVRQILGTDAEARSKAEAQALTEGLSGLDYARRVYQIMQDVRPEDLSQSAKDFAELTTFTNKPYGILGGIAAGINLMNRKTQVTRMVVPFVNVVANVTNEGLNYTPIGAARAAWAQRQLTKEGKAELHGKEITSKDPILDAYSKSAMGALAVGALMAIAASALDDDEPWFEITGRGPEDINRRKALREAGWIPNSIRVGNRYWNFANTPLAIPMAIAGNYMDGLKYGKLAQADLLNRVGYAALNSGQVITEQSFLDSVMRLFGALDHVSQTKSGDRFVDTVARSISSIAIPNALRQIDRMFDPTLTSPPTVEGKLVALVPFARRTQAPAINILGEPVTRPAWERFTSTRSEDQLWVELAKYQAWPSGINQGYLTEEELYDLTKLRGALLRTKLEAAIGKIAASPRRQDAQKVVSELSTEATAKAKHMLGLDALEKLREMEAP